MQRACHRIRKTLAEKLAFAGQQLALPLSSAHRPFIAILQPQELEMKSFFVAFKLGQALRSQPPKRSSDA
jgi:hypothetical protein